MMAHLKLTARKGAARGMSLLEIMIASAIMLLAIAAAAALVFAGGRMARNAELVADSDDASRVAAEVVINAVQLAGMGASRGLWVNQGGVATRISPVFGIDGTTGAGSNTAPAPNASGWDDLWLVVPTRDALQEPCAVPGAYSPLVEASAPSAALTVSCAGSFALNDLLVVSNLSTAALINLTGITPSGSKVTLQYAEQGVSGFSNAPEKNGYQAGDLVYGVSLVHFYVANAPNGVPALYRSLGDVATDTTGRPFSDRPGSQRLIQTNVEDFQVAYGMDSGATPVDPNNYTFQHGLAPGFNGNLRALRINVVARTNNPMRDSQNNLAAGSSTLFGLVPVTVENHVPPLIPPDGFRRSLYSRRTEVLNMLTANL